ATLNDGRRPSAAAILFLASAHQRRPRSRASEYAQSAVSISCRWSRHSIATAAHGPGSTGWRGRVTFWYCWPDQTPAACCLVLLPAPVRRSSMPPALRLPSDCRDLLLHIVALPTVLRSWLAQGLVRMFFVAR